MENDRLELGYLVQSVQPIFEFWPILCGGPIDLEGLQALKEGRIPADVAAAELEVGEPGGVAVEKSIRYVDL